MWYQSYQYIASFFTIKMNDLWSDTYIMILLSHKINFLSWRQILIVITNIFIFSFYWNRCFLVLWKVHTQYVLFIRQIYLSLKQGRNIEFLSWMEQIRHMFLKKTTPKYMEFVSFYYKTMIVRYDLLIICILIFKTPQQIVHSCKMTVTEYFSSSLEFITDPL